MKRIASILAMAIMAIMLTTSNSAQATPVENLELHTFIWSGETAYQIYDGFENETILETSYYTEDEALYGNGTMLGCFFDIPGTTLDLPFSFYIDLFSTYNGLLYKNYDHIDYSTHVEFYNENLKTFHAHAFMGDMSLLTNVTFTGYYGNETVSAAMYLGEAPAPAPVPEPATMLLLGTGLAGLAGIRLRKKQN